MPMGSRRMTRLLAGGGLAAAAVPGRRLAAVCRTGCAAVTRGRGRAPVPARHVGRPVTDATPGDRGGALPAVGPAASATRRALRRWLVAVRRGGLGARPVATLLHLATSGGRWLRARRP